MKVCIFSGKPYKLERNGLWYEGYNYQAFLDDDHGIKFSSKIAHDIYDLKRYKEDFAIDLDLEPRVTDKGKISYREVI